jgi:hypothetical protein
MNPRLQNMFEVGYFAGSKEMIPSGWNVVDEDKTYPTLSSRNPQVYQPIEEDSVNGFEDGRAGSESSEEGSYSGNGTSNAFSSTTRMVEETSDEDEDVVSAAAPRVSEFLHSTSLHWQFLHLSPLSYDHLSSSGSLTKTRLFLSDPPDQDLGLK